MPFFRYKKLPLQSPTRKRLPYINEKFGETNVYRVTANGTHIGHVARYHSGYWGAWDTQDHSQGGFATRDRAAAYLEDRLMRQRLSVA
jgi:hypothetical protein